MCFPPTDSIFSLHTHGHRQKTFEAVNKWKDDLDSKVLLPDGRPIPCVLVGNKSDQPAVGPAAESKAHM